VIPVGDRFSQTLKVMEKIGGVKRTRDFLDCRFVDLVGEYGWSEP
jgi:protein-L-isoaspartate O-methyltransferase